MCFWIGSSPSTRPTWARWPRAFAPARGYFPLGRDFPGIEINRVMDIALKATSVRPGLQVVERLYGLLEVHSSNQGDTRTAGRAILSALGVSEQERLKPRIISSQIIRNIDPHQTQLINRFRRGQMLLAGQTLYILEVQPAGYAPWPPTRQKNRPGSTSSR